MALKRSKFVISWRSTNVVLLSTWVPVRIVDNQEAEDAVGIHYYIKEG